MNRTLKQYFCKHDFSCIATQENAQQNLWRCKKCKVYYISHYRLGIGYFYKTPHLSSWKYFNY